MTPRRWSLVGALILVAAIAIIAVLVMPGEPRSDCDTVRQMLDFNQAHNATISQKGSDGPTETPISDYQKWASQLKTYADDVHDESLARRAQHVAALASRTVTVVSEARDDRSRSPVSGPPPWVREYAQLNAQFTEEVLSLGAACSN